MKEHHPYGNAKFFTNTVSSSVKHGPVNPFKPNTLSHSYHLDEPIASLGMLVVFFIFIHILIKHSKSKCM